MLNALIDFSLKNRFVVLLLAGLLIFIGVRAARRLPLDAFPDTTPVQVQINTVAPELTPEEVERLITFPVKTINLDGYKVQLQENRQSRQMQIKFGDGSLEDKPSDAIREFVKAPDGPDGIKFHWKDEDRAWGTRIDPEAPASSRQKAEQVFKEVVKRVAEEKGVGREL